METSSGRMKFCTNGPSHIAEMVKHDPYSIVKNNKKKSLKPKGQ